MFLLDSSIQDCLTNYLLFQKTLLISPKAEFFCYTRAYGKVNKKRAGKYQIRYSTGKCSAAASKKICSVLVSLFSGMCNYAVHIPERQPDWMADLCDRSGSTLWRIYCIQLPLLP